MNIVTKYKRLAGEKIEIDFYQVSGEDKIEQVIKSPEAPAESFNDALAALEPHFLELAELPEDELQGLQIESVTFSKTGESEILGFELLGSYSLKQSSGSRGMKLPKYLCDSAGDTAKTTNVCNADIKEAIYKFKEECEKYAGGTRLQVNALE